MSNTLKTFTTRRLYIATKLNRLLEDASREIRYNKKENWIPVWPAARAAVLRWSTLFNKDLSETRIELLMMRAADDAAVLRTATTKLEVKKIWNK